MNKKNITIDTQFFDDGIEPALNVYHTEYETEISAKKASSVRQNAQSFDQANINSYRYQYVPDNIYPQYEHQQSQQIYSPQSTKAMKLQSAHQLQDTLSRIMANLFIRCWQTLKATLPQYEYLLHKYTNISDSYQQQIKNKDHQNQPYIQQTNNHTYQSIPQSNYNKQNQQTNYQSKQYVDNQNNASGTAMSKNVFTSIQHAQSDRKAAILERQRRGVTLDSLQKQKLNRSKSVNKIILPERDVNTIFVSQKNKTITNQNEKLNKIGQTIIEDSQKQERQAISRLSGKSYRQRFLQYKHRSKSRGDDMQNNQTYSYAKNVSYIPINHAVQNCNKTYENLRVNQSGHYSLGNLNNTTQHQTSQYNISYRSPASNIYESKNELLQNINSLLYDRQDIYQGEDYKYYINHRDSGKNLYDHTFSYKNIGKDNNFNSTSYQNNQRNIISNSSKGYYKPVVRTQIQHVYHNDKQKDFARARLLQEIVQKLNYSKLRLEIQGKKNKDIVTNDELELIRKITRLQKLVLDHKTQTANSSRINEEKQSQIRNLTLNVNKNHQQELYRKFLDQISSIRSQIHQIKSSRSPSTVISSDNSSNHIILEQQKLLNNYQKELQRLTHTTKVIQREQRKPVTPPPVQQTDNKSFFQQLVQKSKNSQKKVSWNQGWNVTSKLEQQYNQIDAQKLKRRHQHLAREQSRQVYRYTRNQVLGDIGLQNQIRQEDRYLREHQIRQKMEREQREEEIRRMTQKVKQIKKRQTGSESMYQNRPIRQKYQHQWQKYQQTRIDIGEGQNCCALFPC